MVLVEKEKKGHSYTSTRHPTLSDDKKAKLKVFTKEYSHKVLKKLKEKEKLRRIPSSKMNVSNSQSTPQTHISSTTGRAPLDTPPNGSDTRHDDLLDEMFGEVEDDGEGEMDTDDEGEREVESEDPSPPDIATPDGSLIATPRTERIVKDSYGFSGIDPGSTPLSDR